MQIVFDEIEIRPGSVEFFVSSYEREDRIYFDFEKSVVPDVNEVAVAMATMAGQSFDSIHIDLPLDSAVRSGIERFTHAHVTSAGRSE